jgi:hypothetical protein
MGSDTNLRSDNQKAKVLNLALDLFQGVGRLQAWDLIRHLASRNEVFVHIEVFSGSVPKQICSVARTA